MKKLSILISLTLTVVAMQAAVADEPLLQFAPNHFEDWVYNRSDVLVDNDAIILYHITLYTDEVGKQYTLESPAFSCQGVDSLRVSLQCRLADNNNYSPTKVAPRVELLDADGNAQATVDFTVERNLFMQTLVTTFAVPQQGQATLLFSAPRALASEGNLPAVREIKVWAVTAGGDVQPKPGDINDDGVVDVTDVNIVINIMLGKMSATEYSGRADVTGDGGIDVTDVNTVINMMLGKLR